MTSRWPRHFPANVSTRYSCAFSMYNALSRLGVQPHNRNECPTWPGITCLVLGAGELEGSCPDRTMVAFAPFFSLVEERWSSRQCPVINLILMGRESRYPKTHDVPFRADIRNNDSLCAPEHLHNDPEVLQIKVCGWM